MQLDTTPSTQPLDIHSVFSRHVKDCWHTIDQIKVPLHHGLRREFRQKIRDILLDWDKDEWATVDARCRTVFGKSIERMQRSALPWVKKRVRRHGRAPQIIAPLLATLFMEYGNQLDKKTNQPLFNDAAWKSAAAVCELAQGGHLSDPADVALYERAYVDKQGFQVYKCLRGSSKVEGGPHADVYRKWSSPHSTSSLVLVRIC